MKQEFTPYDRALKLKQLGFNEPCVAFYQIEYHEGSPIMVDDDSQYRISGFRTCKNSEIPAHYMAAPTFSQAFRWFREEYNQHSFIELVFEDEIRFDYVLYVNKDEDDCIDYGDGPFETYEDAELALLDKLIEIAEGIKSQK